MVAAQPVQVGTMVNMFKRLGKYQLSLLVNLLVGLYSGLTLIHSSKNVSVDVKTKAPCYKYVVAIHKMRSYHPPWVFENSQRAYTRIRIFDLVHRQHAKNEAPSFVWRTAGYMSFGENTADNL